MVWRVGQGLCKSLESISRFFFGFLFVFFFFLVGDVGIGREREDIITFNIM